MMGSAPSAVRPLSNEPQDSIDWQRERLRERLRERPTLLHSPDRNLQSEQCGRTDFFRSLFVLVMGRKGHRAFGENKEEGGKGERDEEALTSILRGISQRAVMYERALAPYTEDPQPPRVS